MIGVIDCISIDIVGSISASVGDDSVVPERKSKVDKIITRITSTIVVSTDHIDVSS